MVLVWESRTVLHPPVCLERNVNGNPSVMNVKVDNIRNGNQMWSNHLSEDKKLNNMRYRS